MNTTTLDLYIDGNDSISEVESLEHLNELENSNVEVSSFTVSAPTETIYYQSGTSDGYITTYFYRDAKLAEAHFNARHDDYFGGTDSEGSFEVSFFPEEKVTDILQVVEDVCEYSKDFEKYLKKLHPNMLDKWKSRL